VAIVPSETATPFDDDVVGDPSIDEALELVTSSGEELCAVIEDAGSDLRFDASRGHSTTDTATLVEDRDLGTRCHEFSSSHQAGETGSDDDDSGRSRHEAARMSTSDSWIDV
jgi:hypothetical protein